MFVRDDFRRRSDVLARIVTLRRLVGSRRVRRHPGRRSLRTVSVVSSASIVLAVVAAAGCGGSGAAAKSSNGSSAGPSTGAPSAAQLAEARRLINPNGDAQAPKAADVECVARVVVQNSTVDQIANDMAQIPNKDLRQLVMTDYLDCAYDYVLDLYMRFAPAGLSSSELACIRSKFTQLDTGRLSEVIVEDPDAGYTGPLVIKACESGAPTNPLQSGTIPNMGGS
jgi:hypothetical protein